MEGPVAVQGKPVAKAREEAVKLLKKVGLGDKIDLYPYQLPAVNSSVLVLPEHWRFSLN